MKIYFNEKGRFVKAEGSSIFVQSDNANKVQFKLPFAQSDSVVHATFLIPYPANDNRYGQYTVESLLMSLVVDETDGTLMWQGLLSEGYLQNSGKAYISARVQNQTGTVTKTTERVMFEIEPSGVYEATSIPPEQAEQILAKLAVIEGNIIDLESNKQDKVDQALETTDKTVVGAINEVNDKTIANKGNIESNKTEIDTHTQQIAELEQKTYEGIDRIGQIVQPTRPSNDELSQFVRDNTEPPREAQNGDYIEWKKPLNDGTFTLYKFYYKKKTGWSEPDEQAPIETALNTRYGVVRGFKGRKVETDYENGILQDLKDTEGNSIPDKIDQIKQTQTNIINGQQVVGEAEMATQDGAGQIITDTYAEISQVYTRDESDRLFLPSTYNNIYYYTAEGIVDDMPTKEEPQFVANIEKVGDTILFDLTKTLEGGYNFTKNSRDTSVFWVSANRACSVKFKLITRGIVDGVVTDLSYDTTETINFAPNSPREINILTNYYLLENKEYRLEKGNGLEKKLVIISEFSDKTQFSLYCNERYPSTFNLISQSITFNINTINGKLAIDIAQDQWIPYDDGYKVTIPQSVHSLAPSDEYGIDIQLPSGERIGATTFIKENGDIEIYSATAIPLKVLLWVAVNIQEIPVTEEEFRKTVRVIDLGSIRSDQEFDIDADLVQAMFTAYPPVIAVDIANYKTNLFRHDTDGDVVYYSANMLLNDIEYTSTLVVTKATNKGILYQKEEPYDKVPATQHLQFNQLFDTATSELPSANGLVVTNIYGGHHIEGTTTGQYYHKIYEVNTISGHRYYFATNFSDIANVYMVYHIDSTTSNTKYSKVFVGGDKFDIIIQIEKNKTINLDTQPILVDLTEMFGQGNEPTTEVEAQKYLAKNTYYPYIDNPTKAEVNSLSMCPSDKEEPITDLAGYVAPANGYVIANNIMYPIKKGRGLLVTVANVPDMKFVYAEEIK